MGTSTEFQSSTELGRSSDSAAIALLESAIAVALVRVDVAGSDRHELLAAVADLAQLQSQRLSSSSLHSGCTV